MLNIENTFEIGQEVYIVQKQRDIRDCPACDGIGHKVIDGHKFSCVDCHGSGKIYGRKRIYKSEKDIIRRIVIQLYTENGEAKTVIKYRFECGGEYTDKRLFTTQEEAEACCKELNENG